MLLIDNFRRNIENLSKYARKKAQPEGSIAEACIINEALRFCSTDLRDTDTDSNQDEQSSKASLSLFSQPAQPFGPQGSVNFSLEEIQKAHFFFLLNCKELEPYI